MSPISIHRRLNRRLITGIAALLVISCSALGWVFVVELAREFDHSLESQARALAGMSEDGASGTTRFQTSLSPTAGRVAKWSSSSVPRTPLSTIRKR